MLKAPFTNICGNEIFVGDKRRGGQSHMARAVHTPWRSEPFLSGADAADYAMQHGGSWVLLIAARAAVSWGCQDLTDAQLLATIRKNVQQNILNRARRGSHSFRFA